MRFFDMLSPKELNQIHGQALAVLDKGGAVIEHQEVLGLLQSAGARVDLTKKRACFSEHMVEDALASTPNSYLAADSDSSTNYNVPAWRPSSVA